MVNWCQKERFKAVAVCAAELGPTFRGDGAKRLFAFHIWCQAYCAYIVCLRCHFTARHAGDPAPAPSDCFFLLIEGHKNREALSDLQCHHVSTVRSDLQSPRFYSLKGDLQCHHVSTV